MITGIHHLNFLVKDLSASVQYLEKLLQQSAVFDALPERGVNTASFQLGESYIVLVSPHSNEGEPAKILAQRGEGLFLLSFSTPSIEDTFSALKSYGIAPASSPRKGLFNWLVQDINAPDGLGPIIQLCQHDD